MNDILVYENGNGGELNLVNGDIETTDGLFNNPYLSHFGGNVEASTTGDEVEGIERDDWWGNEFLPNEAQMNSELERALNNNALSSAGLSNIEAAAKKDMQVLSEIANVNSVASILGNDKILIQDRFDKTVVNLAWDATKNELIQEITL